MASKISFDELFDTLTEQLANLATLSLKKYTAEAKSDALQFLGEMKNKLTRWTVLLAQGDITTEDFEWLVTSQKDLVKMNGLKQAGLAAIRVDQFKNSVMNMIVDTVFNFIKI